MKPTVPPEPTPPTLDPATLMKALEAAKAESVAVYNEYKERIDGFLNRGGTVRDEVYRELNNRVDAAMWSSQRVSEIIDRALAGTPTPAAAPPTVAPARPAREVVDAVFEEHGYDNCAGRHDQIVEAVTAMLERDRASRSPGALVELLYASDLGRYCGYDHDSATCPMTLPCWHHRRNAACAGKR